jgi:glucan phosphoethanolaminetransferase (alkaline phosphatase superfamily)
MSKKERLKKQKEKQIQMKKLADLEELEEKELAKNRESRGAKKLRRKAKRGYMNVWIFIFKLLMSAAFLWSGFFWGGVLSVGTLNKTIYISSETTMPKWVAYFTLVGVALAFVGIILSFMKKYILSFVLIGAGNIFYFRGVMHMMKILKNIMETQYIESSLENIYKEYMLRHYFFILTAVIAFILLIIWTIQTIKRRRKAKRERDNAPVESIVV